MNTSKTLILANNFRNQFNRRITTYSTFTLSQVRGKGKLLIIKIIKIIKNIF